MADKSAALGVAALVACLLSGCGQKGPLYLPEPASEVVTRPADTPPAENTQAPNSPTTPDSPSTTPSPAPEVTAPEGTPAADDSKSKKEKGAATPPPK